MKIVKSYEELKQDVGDQPLNWILFERKKSLKALNFGYRKAYERLKSYGGLTVVDLNHFALMMRCFENINTTKTNVEGYKKFPTTQIKNQYKILPKECIDCSISGLCPSCVAAPYETDDIQKYIDEKRMCGWAHAMTFSKLEIAKKLKDLPELNK